MIAHAFDTLPGNLPAGRRYVNWNATARAGTSTRTKVPYWPARPYERARVTDPSTWGTLDTARGNVEDGKCNGLGLVLAGDLIAIDLDGCVDPDTRQLAPAAAAILARVPTYTEFSPSGCGLHLLVDELLPLTRQRVRGLEIYAHARFVTLTGAHFPDTPTRIEACPALPTLYRTWFPPRERPASVDRVAAVTLDDQALLEKAHRARNGARFAQLWRGDVSRDPSHSEADADLCRQLAFWTGKDPSRIDRLFRRSGLMRPKWDTVRGDGDTYGSRTVAFAVATTYQTYRQPAEITL